MSPSVFVGIDVAQARLDIALRPGAPFSVPHNEAGIAAAVEQLRRLNPTLIVLEATGAIETALTSALVAAEFARGRGQSASGPGLPQGQRQVGQDGPLGCPNAEARTAGRRYPQGR